METYYELIQEKKDSKDKYISDLRCVFETNVSRLKKKRKIRIAFQTAFVSTWCGDEILLKFLNDERFDASILITQQTNGNWEKERQLLVSHFKKMNVPYIVVNEDTYPGDYDIIVYTTPYIGSLEHFNSRDIPTKTLVCYIPYSFLLSKLQGMQFNQFIHNICWRNYITSKFYFKMADKYCDIGRMGMRFSGFPRMDGFIHNTVDEHDKGKKVIVYAPHHSINGVPYTSTFAENKDYFLKYAKKHQDETYWIVKPHPLLRVTSVEEGLFQSELEYDEYLDQWNRLPNAEVSERDYMECFQESDALILDSVSFLAEYMYVEKPILFLERDGIEFNELGNKIINAVEKCSGTDFKKIDEFVLKSNYTELINKQREVFDRYLNYWIDNSVLASEYIYRDIKNSLEG